MFCVCMKVPLSKKRLNSDDVFILDLGKTIYQWNGKGGNKNEKFKVTHDRNRLDTCIIATLINKSINSYGVTDYRQPSS